MALDEDTMDINLDEVGEAAGGQPAPVGSHLCRITCGALEAIGSGGTQGLRIRGSVVEQNNRGCVTEDVLFWSEAAFPRIKLVLHRIAGIEHGRVTARQIREALDGALARMVVESVTWQMKGDKTAYSEAQAAELRAAGNKLYGHTKISFAGYESATAEEIEKYRGSGPATSAPATSIPNGKAASTTQEKLPF